MCKLLDLRIKTMKKEILKNLISDFTFLRIDSQGNSTDLANRYNCKIFDCFLLYINLRNCKKWQKSEGCKYFSNIMGKITLQQLILIELMIIWENPLSAKTKGGNNSLTSDNEHKFQMVYMYIILILNPMCSC